MLVKMIESIKSLLKQLAQDFQSFSYRQLQHEAQLKEREMKKKVEHVETENVETCRTC